MINRMNERVRIYTLPQTWYGRLLAAVVGVLLLLLAIFFFTFFLIIFALAAIAMTIYVFLFGRKYEKTTSADMIQVEYFLDDLQDESEILDNKKNKSPLD
jgi:predicted membrane protein